MNIIKQNLVESLYADGYSITEISLKVKEERAVVHNCISKKKYTTSNDVEEFNELYYNEKYTIPEISDITNWSIRVIEDKLKDGTIKYNKPRKNELILTTQQLKRIKEMYKKGKSLKAISDKLGLSVSQIRYRLKKSGLYKPKTKSIKPKDNTSKIVSSLFKKK